MADFLGTRDSNVAISEDNVGRKVLILDTITQFDTPTRAVPITTHPLEID